MVFTANFTQKKKQWPRCQANQSRAFIEQIGQWTNGLNATRDKGGADGIENNEWPEVCGVFPVRWSWLVVAELCTFGNNKKKSDTHWPQLKNIESITTNSVCTIIRETRPGIVKNGQRRAALGRFHNNRCCMTFYLRNIRLRLTRVRFRYHYFQGIFLTRELLCFIDYISFVY